jgi:hypothetical protein
MANHYGSLEVQVKKIRSALEVITPPEPDDEFETQRRSVMGEMDKLENYVHGRVTGDGSIQTSTVPGD